MIVIDAMCVVHVVREIAWKFLIGALCLDGVGVLHIFAHE